MKSLSQLRKEVYDYIANSLGVNLNPTQHEELKAILTSVYEYRKIIKNPDQPVEHKVICPKCGEYKLYPRKQGFKNYMKRVPKEFKS